MQGGAPCLAGYARRGDRCVDGEGPSYCPVPFNVTACEGDPNALSLKVMEPPAGPVAVGVKVMLNVQVARGGTTLFEQVEVDKANGPLTAMLEM